MVDDPTEPLEEHIEGEPEGEQPEIQADPAAEPVDPAVAALEAQISANPMLAAKIAAADSLRSVGDEAAADALYQQITASLGLVDPAETATASPLTPAAPIVNVEDEAAEFGLIAHNVETNIEQLENGYESLTQQRDKIVGSYKSQIQTLMRDHGLAEDAATQIATSNWGDKFEQTEQQQKQVGQQLNVERNKANMLKLVDRNCGASKELAAVKATYTKLAWEGKVNVQQRLSDQVKQLAALGIKPTATAPANTVTRSTMTKLKGLKQNGQLAAAKAGGTPRAASTTSAAAGLPPKATLDYFAQLTGRKFA